MKNELKTSQRKYLLIVIILTLTLLEELHKIIVLVVYFSNLYGLLFTVVIYKKNLKNYKVFLLIS